MSVTVTAWLDGLPTSDPWTQDRGLHYGDGLFETMICRQGRIRFAALHAARLAEGCRRLGIRIDATEALAVAAATAGPAAALLKLIVTRGVATARGYAPSGTEIPRQLLLRYPLPPAEPADAPTPVVHLAARLGENPLLAGIKHLNRLELVMARAEMQDSAAVEGLLCSTRGRLACGTQSNLFLVQCGVLKTPRVDRCGIAGVLRAVVLREARRLGLAAQETDLDPADVASAHEAFLTNVRFGVRAITAVDGQPLPVGPVTQRLRLHVATLDA
jgi:4-amino-4-deoxychorismate lyase